MRLRIAWIIGSLAATCVGAAALAQASPPLIDPKASALLKQMCQTLSAARQFSFESTALVDEVTPTGQKLQFGRHAAIQVRRPDAIHAVVKGDRENYTAVFDGKSISFHDPVNNVVATAPMPDTIDAALDTLAMKYGLVVPVADLLFSDPHESLSSRIQAGVHVGEHSVSGVACDHLAFRGESVDWQVWIEKGTSLPRKIVISYKLLPGEPQYIAMLDKWNLSPTFPADLFKFTAPAGAKQIELKPLPEPEKQATP